MRLAVALIVAFVSFPLVAQVPAPVHPMSGAELSTAVRKLPVLASALYIAAHPDDENTAMITWLGNEKLARTGYLAMTRGDGGQNLIGSDIGPKLGVIRTWELLEARSVDGGRQFFSRAIDFGYSKSPEESLRIWGHDEILRDVVRVIRTFRPDILITRFPTDGRGTHGHHTASAILASEAFRLSGDPAAFPELGLPAWQPKRIFWNTWQPEGEEPGKLLEVDLGGYDPMRGESWPEVAARSRTMHKSQGFGAGGTRGSMKNYLVLTGGEAATSGVFDGIDTSWGRIAGSARVSAIIDRIVRAFDPSNPAASLADLIAARRELKKLPESPWAIAKRKDLDSIILSAAGLWLQAESASEEVVAGERVEVAVSSVARTVAPVTVRIDAGPGSLTLSQESPNVPANGTLSFEAPADADVSQPYWLRMTALAGRHQIADTALLGAPTGPPPIEVHARVTIQGETIELDTPVLHRDVDRVQGEKWNPVIVVPHITLEIRPSPLLFAGAGESKTAHITMHNHGDPVTGRLDVSVPAGWKAAISADPVRLGTGESATREIAITPPSSGASGALKASFVTSAGPFDREMSILDYDHIPKTAVFEPAEAKLVRIPLEVRGHRIGYLPGSGDTIPDALAAMGYEVVVLDPATFQTSDLGSLDAIVTGIRALNTHAGLASRLADLEDWVRRGGRVVVQYNTTGREPLTVPFPEPLMIGRDRVTVEEAPVRFVDPSHPLLNTPNRITASDFEGWVQERGLYFASSWDGGWQPVLGMNDPGEDEALGSLLYLPEGKGAWIYSGLSFFRELPAGVPGAWRLFANLVSGE